MRDSRLSFDQISKLLVLYRLLLLPFEIIYIMHLRIDVTKKKKTL